jgi:hypothetical protein
MGGMKILATLGLLLPAGAWASCGISDRHLERFVNLQDRTIENACELNRRSDVNKKRPHSVNPDEGACESSYFTIRKDLTDYQRFQTGKCQEIQQLRQRAEACQSQDSCLNEVEGIMRQAKAAEEELANRLKATLEKLEPLEKDIQYAIETYKQEEAVIGAALERAAQPSLLEGEYFDHENATALLSQGDWGSLIIEDERTANAFGSDEMITARSRGASTMKEYHSQVSGLVGEQVMALHHLQEFNQAASSSISAHQQRWQQLGQSAAQVGAIDLGSTAMLANTAAPLAVAGMSRGAGGAGGGVSTLTSSVQSIAPGLSQGAAALRGISGSSSGRSVAPGPEGQVADAGSPGSAGQAGQAFGLQGFVKSSEKSTRSLSSASTQGAAGGGLVAVSYAEQGSEEGFQAGATETQDLPPERKEENLKLFKGDLGKGRGVSIAGSEIDLTIKSLFGDLAGEKKERISVKEGALSPSERRALAGFSQSANGQEQSDAAVGGMDSEPIFARVRSAHLRSLKQGLLIMGLKEKL